MFVDAWLAAAFLVFALLTLLWLLSLLLRDSSIVDIFWGMGFVATAWYTAAVTIGPANVSPRGWLMLGLVTLWGVRLSAHILMRNWGRGEDYRYRQWREQAGAAWWWRSYFKVFALQGVILLVVAAPVVWAVSRPGPAALSWLDAAAATVWLAGFYFEAAGDWQLMRFKANPAHAGQLMTSGVWRYTRHPNYFGDATAWWGHFLVAAAAGGWWTVFSPVLMTFLLVRVSGVAMLETTLRERKPGYRDYMEATSAFIPMPPRRRRDAHNPGDPR